MLLFVSALHNIDLQEFNVRLADYLKERDGT